MSEDQVSYLDYQIQRWLDSIPPSLRLSHAHLVQEADKQDRKLQQLRTLLYLCGNQMRTLLHRQHVMSFTSISKNSAGAGVVVQTAKDTIEVLVHLHKSSDIYLRQQITFNHFLVSALAAIFLAVCHAPTLYSTQCRDTFYNAIELLRGFAKISTASRRLWENVKGLLPGAKTLGLDHMKRQQNPKPASIPQPSETGVSVREMASNETLMAGTPETWMSNTQNMEANSAIDTSLADSYQMSQDLTSFFEVFGQSGSGDFEMGNDSSTLFAGDTDEVSRLFQGLI
jgi:hypothetical protein